MLPIMLQIAPALSPILKMELQNICVCLILHNHLYLIPKNDHMERSGTSNLKIITLDF